MAVQHHAQGLALEWFTFEVSGGQLRVVGQHRIDANHHGVALSPHLLNHSASLWPGNPLGVTGMGGYLPVQAHGIFGGDKGQARGDVLGEGFVQFLCRIGLLTNRVTARMEADLPIREATEYGKAVQIDGETALRSLVRGSTKEGGPVITWQSTVVERNGLLYVLTYRHGPGVTPKTRKEMISVVDSFKFVDSR